MPRTLRIASLAFACITTGANILEAQSVVLRTVGVGADGGSSAQWTQGVHSGSGAIGMGSTVERTGDLSRQVIGVGLGEMTALSFRSTWYRIPRLDSLVIGDVHFSSPLRGALPGPSSGIRTATGAMFALPAWDQASLRLTIGSAAPRAHAGGVNGIALISNVPRSAIMGAADLGEPECEHAASWSCTVASINLTQDLPRSARITTTGTMTADLSRGGTIAHGEMLLDGGSHRYRAISIEPGAALHIGRAAGASAWSRMEHQRGGAHVRLSHGTLIRPAVRLIGFEETAAPESLTDIERFAARQANLDLWWSPKSWLRAGAGIRAWSERSRGAAAEGAMKPDELLDPMLHVQAGRADGWSMSGATQGHHASASLAVFRGSWQGSASTSVWEHESRSLTTSEPDNPAAATSLTGRDVTLNIARSDSYGRRWRGGISLMDANTGRRGRLTTRFDQPIGLTGTVSTGALLRWDERLGFLLAPTASVRWMLPFGQLGLDTQFPLGGGTLARAERWVGGTAEFNLGRWVASVSQVHTASGLVWRLSARRAWRGSSSLERQGYERAAKGALWIHGRVLMSTGEPLVALPVTVAGATAFTDDEGRFSIRISSAQPPDVQLAFDNYPGGALLHVVMAPDRIVPMEEAMPRAGTELIWQVERRPFR